MNEHEYPEGNREGEIQFQCLPFSRLDLETLYEILAHREEVFVLGQGNLYRDLDGRDQRALHLTARSGEGELLGYVRLLPRTVFDGGNSFGRLSVLEKARGRGLGAELVRRACAILLRETGDGAVQISAMAYLLEFYKKLGFVPVSGEFDIAGVPHVSMRRPGESACVNAEREKA